MPPLIYLDNAATTRMDPRVIEAMAPYFTSIYGNASSLHAMGRAARRALDDARSTVAGVLDVSPAEIVFTSGGTESDNLAVLGVARARRSEGRAHVVISAIEHSAVLNAARQLEREGFRITRLPVTETGHVRPDDVASAVGSDTALVSVMAVNNEIGTLQPLRAIGALTHAAGARFHVDAVQAAGHIGLTVADWHADLVTLSAHKVNGPKGVGVLMVRDGVRLEPLSYGGEHERQRRPGTENIPGIVGCAEALRLAAAERATESLRLRGLRDRLERELLAHVPKILINGQEPRAPHVLNASFPAAGGEAMLVNLDAMGICVSTGSACAAHSAQPSHVLLALGRSPELAQASLRFSLGRETTAAEIDTTAAAVAEVVARLRRMSPLWE